MTRAHAVDQWLGELGGKGLSERTIDTYRRFLHHLIEQDPLGDIDDLTPAQVRRLLDEQARRKRGGGRKAPATIAQNVSIMNGFLDWLTFVGIITRNPARRNGQRILSRPKLQSADENDNVKTVSGADVAKIIEAADRSGDWGKRLAVNVAAYLGPRRAALSSVRITDYDAEAGTLRFQEKGNKTIAKSVPYFLADLIDAAIAAGVYDDQDYLVPGRESPLRKDGQPNLKHRTGVRDDRVIWWLITEVAADAGVDSHVHSLRAAFAVEYLETHPHQNSLFALKELMGHRRIETTLVYLRRLRRREAMETVRDMDWGRHGAAHDNERISQNALKPLVAKRFTEKEGFEPSFEPLALLPTPALQSAEVEPAETPS